MTKKVVVTGGNGHLGNTLAKLLCERGYAVRITVRNPEEVKASGIFDGYNLDIVQADIRDEEAMRSALTGMDGLFQVAALYHYDEQEGDEEIIANNTKGSHVVLKVARELGISRVVYTSSIAAIGFGGSKEAPLTEECWNETQDPYCRSKLLSEREAWAYANEAGLDLVTICPSIILGPNFYKHTPSTVNVGAFINNQLPFRFPLECSVVDVRDVAEAHILAMETKQASGRYLVPGYHIDDLVMMLREFDDEMVMPERVLSMEEAKQLAIKAGTPVELVGQPYRYSDAKARAELDWKPRPLADTLRDTIQWIKEQGL